MDRTEYENYGKCLILDTRNDKDIETIVFFQKALKLVGKIKEVDYLDKMLKENGYIVIRNDIFV